MVIDILVGIILLISALISFLRGFIREVLTIFGTIGALAAAYFAGPHLGPLMRGWLGVQEGQDVPKLFDLIPYTVIADVLAYGAVFLSVLIALSIVSHILAEAVRKVGLGAVDRVLGVGFGLARGFIILALMFIPVKLFAAPTTLDSWFEGSVSRAYLDIGADWLVSLLPENAFDMPAPAPESEDDMRAKLDKMKLLGGDTAQKIEEALKSGIKPEEILKQVGPAAEKGYTEEFRQQMDKLFKQEAPPDQTSPPQPESETPPTTDAPAQP